MERIMARYSASVTELKKNPMAILREAEGEPVAILNHNKAAGYFIPADLFERMMDYLEDVEILKTVKERRGEELVKVNLDDL